MTSGVTTRLQRKVRNTSRPSTTSSATASVTESISVRSNVPLPTHTVTVTVKNSESSQEAAKEEEDPLSMSETARSSPAPNGNARRASSTGNQSNDATTFPAKIKMDPDGDVVMKTESEGGNNWPINGINVKHEYKNMEIKQEHKSSSDDASLKESANQNKDDKKIEIKKENEDKENEDGMCDIIATGSRRTFVMIPLDISVKNKNSSSMEINDEWNDVEAR